VPDALDQPLEPAFEGPNPLTNTSLASANLLGRRQGEGRVDVGIAVGADQCCDPRRGSPPTFFTKVAQDREAGNDVEPILSARGSGNKERGERGRSKPPLVGSASHPPFTVWASSSCLEVAARGRAGATRAADATEQQRGQVEARPATRMIAGPDATPEVERDEQGRRSSRLAPLAVAIRIISVVSRAQKRPIAAGSIMMPTASKVAERVEAAHQVDDHENEERQVRGGRRRS